MNPYQAPRLVDGGLSNSLTERTEPRVSNRMMSIVIACFGVPLVLVAAYFFVSAAVGGMATELIPTWILFGAVTSLLGIAMVSVATFLWRYDAPHA